MTAQGQYRDAIVLPDDHNFTEEQIEEMKVQRVDHWLAFLEESRIQAEQEIALLEESKIQAEQEIAAADATGDLNG
jgi:hypothetical protein